MHKIVRLGATLLAAWFTVMTGHPALAQPGADPAGDWHGVLAVPGGSLRLIITISHAEGGALKADLESPDQAPGQKIPATTISVQGEELSFAIDALRISYKGKWIAAEQSWQGTFTQGADLPLKLSRK